MKAKTVQERKRLVLGNDETRLVDEPEKKNKGQQSMRPILAIGIDMGFSIAIPMTVGTILGVYLDKRFDTAPVLTLTLLFFSVVGSVYSMYKLITKELNKF